MDTNPEQEVAEQTSVEDQLEAKFAARFGEDKAKPEPEEEEEAEEVSDDQPEAEAAPEEELADLDIDGFTVKVPKTKAEKLQSERLMQQDYTKKTQELARQREVVELQEKRVQLGGQAQAVLGQKHAEILATGQQLQQYEQVNWAQLTAEEAYPLIVKRDELRASISTKQAEMQQMAQDFQQRQAATDNEWKQKLTELGTARLNEELGGWTHDKVQATSQRLKSLGYQDKELGDGLLVYDPRFLRMAYESAQYQRLQETKAQTIEKKVAQAKPFVAPAARNTQTNQANSKLQDMRDKMRKTGKSDDVESFLATRFAAKRR